MRVAPRAVSRERTEHARSLRVGVITDTYPPEVNGVAMTMGQLVRGLRVRGHRVAVVRARQQVELDGRAETSWRIDPGDDVRPSVPLPRYAGIRLALPARQRLVRRWKLDRPDVVHIVTEGMLGWSALRAANRLGIPVTSGFHTNFHEYVGHYRFAFLARTVRGWLRHFHNCTQATFVPTEEVRAGLTAVGFERVHVLSRGVDTQRYSPERRNASLRASWGVGPDDLALVYVGRIAPEKNVQLALAAFERIRATQPSARFVLVGPGPSRDALVGHPGIVLAGTRRGLSLAAHYASGDLFVFPSRTETFGNVVLEAMASGLPVVAFRYAAPAIHGRDHVNARLVPLHDSDAWLDAACELAAAPATRARLGRAARDRATQVSWSAVVDRFESLLGEIAEEPRRTSS